MQMKTTYSLPGDHPWQKQIILLDSVESTNTLAKEMAKNGAPHGTVLIADCQTGGRGRLGRSFHSPGGMGIYMSVILRYACKPEQLMHLTCACAVSVCDAVTQAAGIRPKIKWINDLVVGQKKLAGILTELVINGQETCAIVGIGLNVCQKATDFDPQIQSIATSLALISGQQVARQAIFDAILQNIYEMDQRLLSGKADIMARYRKECITIGQHISVVRGDEIRHGQALAVTDEGALLVRYDDGPTQEVNSGEVSIRGMYGYV